MFRRNAAMREVFEVDTIIGAHTEVRGKVCGATGGVIRIEGRLQGELESEGDAVIGEGGEVVANIRARDVIIGGTVHGDVEAGGRLELLPTARVYGDVRAGLLVIAEGALFQGTCQGEPQHVDDYLRPAATDLLAVKGTAGKAAGAERAAEPPAVPFKATAAAAAGPSGTAAGKPAATAAMLADAGTTQPFPPLGTGRERDPGGAAAAAPASRDRWPQQAREHGAEPDDGPAGHGGGTAWTAPPKAAPQVASGGTWH